MRVLILAKYAFTAILGYIGIGLNNSPWFRGGTSWEGGFQAIEGGEYTAQ
jgi:biotin transporter BioY